MTHSRIRVPRCSVFCAVPVILCAVSVTADDRPFVYPAVEVHRIESAFVDETFEVRVQVPIALADGSERFPVLYLTDSYGGVIFSEITALMQVGGDIPRFITVGIGYPLEHALGGMALRERELTPTLGEIDESLAALVQGIPVIENGKKTGGAAEFLQFIRQELQPFVDKRYPTVPEDRGYFGDSLGGLFGLYVLFNEPDTFNRYIIGSPSIWWDDGVILKQAEEFLASGEQLNAHVFLSVGALEEQGGEMAAFRMVTNVFKLESMLRSAKVGGLNLTTHLFPNETHTTVVAMNYIRGVQTVYSRPDVSFLQRYAMKQMASE